MTRTETAKLLGVSVGTLANWAAFGVGPAFAKKGRNTVYLKADVERWRKTETCKHCGQRVPLRFRKDE